MVRKIIILMSCLLMCVAGVMAQTSDEPVVLRKVQNAQLVLVKDQIKLVLFTD